MSLIRWARALLRPGRHHTHRGPNHHALHLIAHIAPTLLLAAVADSGRHRRRDEAGADETYVHELDGMAWEATHA